MKGCKTIVAVLAAILLSAHFVTPAIAADVNDLEKRVRSLEDMMGGQAGTGDWAKRIRLSGLMEVEAFYEAVDLDGGDDTTTSDIDLAKAALAVDATITKNVIGHFIIQYEDGDVILDEGYVAILGGEKCPSYIHAGYQVVPFGQFDSHFITDPITKDLGETKEGSLVLGYRVGEGFLDFSAGIYNGKTGELGDDDDMIEGYALKVAATPVEGLTAGIAYISSIADSGGLNGQVQGGGVDDYVSGWNAFVTFSMMDFRLIAEYISALDEFEADDIYALDAEERQPSAINFEFGYAITDAWEVAARYAVSDDGVGFLPESQYGAIVNWGVFNNSNLGFEYQHAEYDDASDTTTDAVTVQLAVEF